MMELRMTLIMAIENMTLEIKAVESISAKQAPLTHCEHV